VQNNLRTGPLLKRFLLPWNWFRPSVPVQALEAAYHEHLTGLLLTDLPERPAFVFCATDMVFGVSWVFERRRVGSYQAGYLIPAPDWPVARAVAASSCFPPVFSPLPIEAEPGQVVVDGTGRPNGTWAGMSVSDGGLYDNLGLQPVERHGVVLVSDGGQPFVAAVPRGLFGRAKAYLDILGKQAGAVRKRLLIAQYQDGERQGAYWGVGSAVRRYRADAQPGYEKGFAANTIARIRTDLDAFSEPEIAVVVNHGYLLADIAMEVHAPQLIAQATEERVPYPEWLDEGRALEALKDSDKRWWLGRG
jgi:NTE family protein